MTGLLLAIILVGGLCFIRECQEKKRWFRLYLEARTTQLAVKPAADQWTISYKDGGNVKEAKVKGKTESEAIGEFVRTVRHTAIVSIGK